MKTPQLIVKSLACLALALVLTAALSAPRLLAQDLRENEPLSQLPTPEPPPATGTDIAEFVRYAYLFGISFVAVAATVSIMYGGAKYMFSAIPGVKEDAKDRITNAAIGLALALGAFVILRTINPDLVSFRPLRESLLRLEEPAQPGSGRIVIQPGDACNLTAPNLCAAGSTCRPDNRPDSTTGATCQQNTAPQLLGRNDDCSRNPNACGPGLQCAAVSGNLVCTDIPPASGVAEFARCVPSPSNPQGNCGTNSTTGRPLRCQPVPGAPTAGVCRSF